MDSAVPYSLSDIQLPDSPSNIMKSNIKTSSKKETLPPPSSNDSDKESHSDSDVHKNGLNSGSLPKAKSVLEEAPSKKKISILEPKRSSSQSKVSKESSTDSVAESAFLQKSNKSKSKNLDSDEKIGKIVEEKSFKSTDKHPESHTNNSSGEDSSSSNSSRKKKQLKSKTSVKHSKISKQRSRSSSSSSDSSQSQERTPKRLSKDSKSDEKKSFESRASRVVKKDQSESFDPKTSKSKHRSSSSSQSSQSREASPVELSKKDAKKSVLHDVSKISNKGTDKILDRKASKSRSRSPPGTRSSRGRERSPVKSSKKYDKKLLVPDAPKIARERYTSSSDQNTSKSRSRSPTSRQSSKGRKKSPVKQSKDDSTKQVVSDPSLTGRKCDDSSYQKSSKSRSRSPTSSRSSKGIERSPAKPFKKDSNSDKNSSRSRSRSPSSNRSRKSPVETTKGAKKVSLLDASRKNQEDDIAKKISKSRSRSRSRSQSRERSPLKRSKPSRTQKHHIDQRPSKSRSRSPSSSGSSPSQDKSPKKFSKEDAGKTVLSDESRTNRKHESSSSDQKALKSRSRSRSSSSSPPPHHALELLLSKKKPSVQTSKEVPKSAKSDVSKPVDQKSDPPRKKLKINRNNVVIPPLGSSEKASIDEQKNITSQSAVEKTSKVTRSSPEKEQRESTSLAQLEVVEPEMGEIIENSPEVKYEPRKINFPGRKLSRKSSEDQSSSEPKSKKSKWGKFASSQKSSHAINISTDSLKNWFPEFKLVSEPSAVNDSMPEESPPVKEDKKLTFPVITEEEPIKHSSTNDSHPIKDEPTLEISDSSCPVSKIVFIQNLVRPFTLLQLKELLRQTGSFMEDDFWIDKIKSKCFVTYATEEEAVKTRNALNGVRWPSSNPKILSAEFSTEEEFEHHRSGKDTQKPAIERLPEVHETYEEKTPQLSDDHRRKERDSDKRKERERYRTQAPVREWDKDKVLQDSPDREKPDKNIEGFRGSDKKDKKDTKKRPNEDTPAKLLDDLFQKTKSAPCIYWLPLTEAQVLEHEESKRIRRIEREKRNQQREKEESEQRNKRSRLDHRTREVEHRRSSTRSRSPTSRRR